jgi:hypothetical protein
MPFAQAQVAEPPAGQRAAGPHPELGHAHCVAEQVHAFGRRADANTGSRRQGCAQHVRWREHIGGADLDHRRAIQRLVRQREQRAGKTQFAHDQRAGGVGMVAGVADHGPGLCHARKRRLAFGELTVHHVVATIAQFAGQRHVLLEDHEWAVGADEFIQQGLDRRAISVEQHHARHRRQHVRQPRLELLLEVRQHEDREDQEHQELAHELPQDDEERHGRVVPAAVAAITGGGERLGRPLQTLHEGPRCAFQVGHAQHVQGAQDHHRGRQHGQQCQQAPGGTLEIGEHGVPLNNDRCAALSAGISIRDTLQRVVDARQSGAHACVGRSQSQPAAVIVQIDDPQWPQAVPSSNKSMRRSPSGRCATSTYYTQSGSG